MDFDIRSLKILPDELADNIREFNKEISWDKIIPTPDKTPKSLVSSVEGEIKTILFHYADKKFPKKETDIKLHLVIVELARLMPHVNFIVITDINPVYRNGVNLEEFFRKKTDNVCLYPIIPSSSDDFSYWAADPYVAIQAIPEKGEAKRYLVTPEHLLYRINDKGKRIPKYTALEGRITEQLLEDLVCKVKITDHLNSFYLSERTPIALDGGNMLVGDEFIFVGKSCEASGNQNSIHHIIQNYYDTCRTVYSIGTPPQQEKPKAYKEVDRSSNKTIINSINALDSEDAKQSIFHLDLFLTLAGRNQKEEYQVVIPKPILGLTDQEKSLLPSKVIDYAQKEVNRLSSNICPTIDYLRQIECPNGFPFSLVEMPLVLTYRDTVDSTGKHNRIWFWLSYHNAIVEWTNSSKKVWLPSYNYNYSCFLFKDKDAWKKAKHIAPNIESLKYGNWSAFHQLCESEIKQTWENKLGFDEVYFVEANLIHYAKSNGSLACLINCIDRNI